MSNPSSPEDNNKKEDIVWYTGRIARGDGRGRLLGFPTANVYIESATKNPFEGIYAGWAQLDNEGPYYKAAIHIGPRPTFSNATPTVELHLLHFPDKDLYGQTIRFCLSKRLRDIRKFATIEELTTTIANDCFETDTLLKIPPS